jgi:hypothetical protein
VLCNWKFERHVFKFACSHFQQMRIKFKKRYLTYLCMNTWKHEKVIFFNTFEGFKIFFKKLNGFIRVRNYLMDIWHLIDTILHRFYFDLNENTLGKWTFNRNPEFRNEKNHKIIKIQKYWKIIFVVRTIDAAIVIASLSKV